ncbi:MAG: hypothetical protein A3B41_02735 [Candidatus Levybacteria bacterium RIFCSPLOWO2_01_FULL_37_26]|nr:MAG: hypothetical protein A3B41_02735 [Candidatus Levybacteria bacterium RIFCSPLOWO2_01_FULL_37_26]
MGWIFFWAFLDKLLGLGFATETAKSWLSGNSPTTGFLKFATHGPFKPFFESLAGSTIVDWLFMIGLFGIGLSLILGIGMRIAAYSGSLLLFLMWLALLPPENNPILDDHIIYILVLMVLDRSDAGEYFGFGKSWKKTSLVKKYPLLR